MNKLNEHKFDELYEMNSGLSSTPEQAGHGAPFVSFSTVFNNYFLPDSLTDKMDTSEHEQETYSIKKGDILLTRTSETIGDLAMSCIALKDYPRATYSGFVKRLRPKQKKITYDKYMGFYLRSKFFRKTITNNAFMTLRASLNEAIFSYLKLYLPNYETQKNIGDLLFLLNSKIELNNRINSELETMAKTLYDYWFVQFDFPDEKGKPYKSSGGKMVWNKELKREIPEGWEVKKISEVAAIRAGGDKPEVFSSEKTENCSIPIYSNGIENDGLYGFTDKAIINDQSITISARGTIGYCALRNEPFVPIIRLIVITPHGSSNTHFVYEYLRGIGFGKTGSVQQQLTVPQVSSFNILYPPADLLKKYDEITSFVFKEIDVLKEQNIKLASLLDWFLPMLMNGQVKVQ